MGSNPTAVKYFIDTKMRMETPGIEPGTSRMRSERSTTELHPLQLVVIGMSQIGVQLDWQGWPSGLRREI